LDWIRFAHFERYLECIVEGKTLHLRRRINAISQASNRFCRTILLSATKRRWDEVLSLYFERDEVEKKFDDRLKARDSGLLDKKSIEEVLLELAKLTGEDEDWNSRRGESGY